VHLGHVPRTDGYDGNVTDLAQLPSRASSRGCVASMRSRRPLLFRKRKFEPIVIVTAVRWYCRFCLSLRDVEELVAERGYRSIKRRSGGGSRLHPPRSASGCNIR